MRFKLASCGTRGDGQSDISSTILCYPYILRMVEDCRLGYNLMFFQVEVTMSCRNRSTGNTYLAILPLAVIAFGLSALAFIIEPGVFDTLLAACEALVK